MSLSTAGLHQLTGPARRLGAGLPIGSARLRVLVLGWLLVLATVAAGAVAIWRLLPMVGGADRAVLVYVGAPVGGVVVVELFVLALVYRTVSTLVGVREEFEAFEENLTAGTQESCAVMGRCEEGDLSARMATDTEIPQLNRMAEDFNHMMDYTEAVVSAAREFGEEVEVASGNTVARIEQAERATEEVSDVAQSINAEIEERLAESVGQVEALRDEAREISEVAEFVSNVARQTNMLGVNARIEASKSADDNVGFRTVAGQVKELADETQEAADDIQDLLDRLQDGVHETLDEIETTKETVDEGTYTVQYALNALTDDDQPEDIDDLVIEAGIVEPALARYVKEELDGVSINEVRTSAEELTDRAEKLQRALAAFTVSDDVDYGVLDDEAPAEYTGGHPTRASP